MNDDTLIADPIAVIGGGSIGIAFAILFARAGRPVRVHDPDPARRSVVPDEVGRRLSDLLDHGLIVEPPAAILARITTVSTLNEALAGAVLVQECAPEQLALKRGLFADLDRLAPAEAILASASSALQPSSFADQLPGRGRCLVTHPLNPPYLIPVIEIVPAPFTSEAVVTRCEQLYRAAGMSPIRVRKEVEGFVLNRLQGALLREAYCLVRDGVATVDDIDQAVRDALGLRWSVIGPFETADLNTRGGIAAHAVKMGPAYERMGAERGQHDPWTAEMVAGVVKARRRLLPLDLWEDRVAWRDRRLMDLLVQRRSS
jgi:3-hydroxyacyl-CoA dehydrogenase